MTPVASWLKTTCNTFPEFCLKSMAGLYRPDEYEIMPERLNCHFSVPKDRLRNSYGR
jgi:hypothetical protein